MPAGGRHLAALPIGDALGTGGCRLDGPVERAGDAMYAFVRKLAPAATHMIHSDHDAVVALFHTLQPTK